MRAGRFMVFKDMEDEVYCPDRCEISFEDMK